VGLAPPEFKTKKGNLIAIGENRIQTWLNAYYTRALEDLKGIIGRQPFNLVINGDAIEGIHHRSPEVVSQYWEEHLGIAKAVLKPLTSKANEIFVVKGTECHTQGLEDDLARNIGAVGGKAENKWLFRMNGHLIDATHHISTSGRAYLEASALGIFMGNARLNYARDRHEVPKIFLRGHRHAPGEYSDGRGRMIITGAWQGLTRYGHKVVPDSLPCPSISVLDWTQGFALPTHYSIQYEPPQQEIYETN
jgi:hypothetical protein